VDGTNLGLQAMVGLCNCRFCHQGYPDTTTHFKLKNNGRLIKLILLFYLVPMLVIVTLAKYRQTGCYSH